MRKCYSVSRSPIDESNDSLSKSSHETYFCGWISRCRIFSHLLIKFALWGSIRAKVSVVRVIYRGSTGGQGMTESVRLLLVKSMHRGHPFMMSTRREKGVRLRWTHVDGGGRGSSPCGRPHRKLKLESTDFILSSSHAKKGVFFTRISSLDRKNVDIFLRYKLVI